MRSPIDDKTAEDLLCRFRHHVPPSEDAGVHLLDIRGNCQDLATMLCEYCPQGRELSLALTKLEEAMFWANAAIARTWKVGT